LAGLASTVALLTRVIDGSEGGSFTATAGSTVSGIGLLGLTPGSGNTLTVDGTPTSNSAGNGATATPGSITTTQANDILIAGFSAQTGPFTTPTGMTEVLDTGNFSLDYESIASAGATGSRSSTAGFRAVGVMMALKEVTASSPATVNPPVVTGSGTALVPSVGGEASVVAVTPSGSGTALAPSLSGSVLLSAPVVTGIGTVLVPVVGIFVFIDAPLMTGSGTAYAPTLTAEATVVPPTVTGVGTVNIPSIQVPASIAAPLLNGSGVLLLPTLQAEATLAAPLLSGTGAIQIPIITAEALLEPPVLAGVGVALEPTLMAEAVIEAAVAQGYGVILPPFVAAALFWRPYAGKTITQSNQRVIIGRTKNGTLGVIGVTNAPNRGPKSRRS
jgi:hypothetical protein